MTTTIQDLNDAVVASLKESGKLGQITAEIRAEVYKILSEDEKDRDKIPLCKENFIINELIREYLQFNGYSNSLSVFMHETGQPEEPMNRDFLAHSLEVTPHKQIPILYTLTSPSSNKNLTNEPKKQPENSPSPSKLPQKQNIVKKPLYSDDDDEDNGFFVIKSTK